MTNHSNQRPPVGPRTAGEMLAFQRELDELRRQVWARLGESDARYVTRLLWITRGLESLGRCLLLFGGWCLPIWIPAVVILAISHLIETMELGHNLMHGQFNWMNDARFSGRGYRWNFACAPEDWCEFHNHTHHQYSNVQGKDRDYGSLRLTAHQPWERHHLFQCFVALLTAVIFEWGVALHNLELERRRLDPVRGAQRIQRLWPRARARMLLTVRREYLWWPVLGALVGAAMAGVLDKPVLAQAGLGALAVFGGNAAASVLRNLWGYFIIACGHFTAEAHTFLESDLRNETKGQWYLRQILSAANFECSVVVDVLSGNASHQIEHHIYPDLPSNRLAEIAPAVQDICKRYGVPYNTGSLPRQVASVVARMVRHSFPGGWYNLTSLKAPDHDDEDLADQRRVL